MAKIGFIGMGNMGFAILQGLLKLYRPEDLLFTDVNQERMETVKKQTGVDFVESNAECANQSRIVVLAVKPQYYDAVLKNIKYAVKPEQIVISIAPGITIDSLVKKLGDGKRIVRAMPNTPALLGEGMTGVTYDRGLFTEEEEQEIRAFFQSFGRMEYVEERLMSAVVCASGSSPAYVYMFIEALADSAVRYGLPRDKAYEFAAQTVKGAAEMVLQTGKHPGELKDMVCSPAGTTIAGVAALEEYGFRNAVLKANEACYEKCEAIK
ncbi:pyrroline-5-carboxylate reductase [Oscillospiraceae bacterium Marseille-Q3528]|nr:pyrroline-5-carboxylate reductase [Oscillospiraceae bacterium Marseille-Q3528]WNV57106.1 pyrroline-5-carboxylate reductase [Oscillospiraceae bacterium NTUH-002-81]